MQIIKQAWLNSNHAFTDVVRQSFNPMTLPQVAGAAKQARPDSASSSWTFWWEDMAFAAKVDDLGVLIISFPEEV